MTQEHFVIIGNGPAANAAAAALREGDPEARITIIGRETVRQYKPHRLPDFIAGKKTEAELFLAALDWYKDRDIRLRLGQEVVDVDFAQKVIALDHKEIIRFTGLIIAVGGKPRVPEPLQKFGELMLPLKTLSDARAWIDHLSRTETVLVVGGDLTSFALTKALLSMGKKVKFLFDKECFWPLRLGEQACADAIGRLADKQVEVLKDQTLKNLRRVSDDVLEVETDKDTFQVGIVGAFFGLVPDVGFLNRTGLHIEKGILVNEFLKTRFDRVYAAGDCAQVFHPAIRDYWVSIGYDNAKNLGKVAATNLLGGTTMVQVEPSSIFEIEGIKINNSWWMEF